MIGRDYKVNNKQGVSLFLTGIAVLCFFYISFLGFGYFLEGLLDSEDVAYLLPSFLSSLDPLLVFYISISLFYILLLSFLLYLMCNSKSKRNKRIGLPIEITSGVVILALLLIGCIPFMKFLYIVEEEDSLLDDVALMRKSALDIDADYLGYVEKRVDNFLKNGTTYYGIFSKSTASSLKRRLIPLNYKELKEKRALWLEEMSTVSIWNPCTAHNVKAIMKASETWVKEYSLLSSLSYQHEITDTGSPITHFEHKVSQSNCNKWMLQFKQIDIPDWRALSALVIVVILFFSLYMSIDRPRNIITGTHENS